MYTVARFSFPQDNPAPIRHFLEVLRNAVGAEERRPDRGDSKRVSHSVCTDTDWQEHESAITDFIGAANGAISYALEQGARVIFDVAVEPEDRVGPFFCLSPSATLLETIVRGRCSLAVTIY